MKKQTAILTVFFLFLFMGSASAGYVGTIETWTETLTCTTREWGEIDTWTNTLTAYEAPGEDWDTDVETWTNTLTAEVDYVPPDPPTAYMCYMYAEANDIYALAGQSGTYLTAHTTYHDCYDGIAFQVGQFNSGTPTYSIRRGYLELDLSLITTPFTGGTWYFSGIYDHSTIDFDMHLYGFTESSLLMDSTTYNGYGTTSFGFWDSSTYSGDQRGIGITLNEDGIDYINDHLGETVYFVLRSSRDVSETPPSTDYEYIVIKSPETANADDAPVFYYNSDSMVIDTWTETLTVSPYAEWEEIDTWTETLTVSGEEESDYPGPLVPWNTLIVKILLPMILLFSLAFILHGEIGFVGFIIGSMIGLFIVYTTIGMPLGLVILGLFTLAAIWWRMD